MPDRKQIIIAWTVPGLEWDGQPYARDLGARPTMTETVEARAVTWILDGTDSDVEMAQSHAETIEGAVVYTFDQDHADPLAAARAMVASTGRPFAEALPFGLDSQGQISEPFCACGRVVSNCDHSRRGCAR